MKTKVCPKCKSTQIFSIAGNQTGISQCANCGFSGTLFPEVEELKKVRKK